MDISGTTNTGPIAARMTDAACPVNTGQAELSCRQQLQAKKIAMDFEAIFMQQIFNSMRQTVNFEESEDSSSQQIGGMYWSFLADAVAGSGGVGLCNQIYKSILESQSKSSEGITGIRGQADDIDRQDNGINSLL